MMVGALLTKCDCNACDAYLPTITQITLTKQFNATNKLSYINYTLPGVCGPVETRVTTFSSDFECQYQNSREYSTRGPLPIDPNFLAWSPPILPPSCENNFIVTVVNSETQASVSWTNPNRGTIQTTTGGYHRPGTNTILVTGGIPIRRYVYQLDLNTGPEGLNNEPSFVYQTIEEPTNCCVSTNKIFPSVTGGNSTLRSISSADFDMDEYSVLYFRYVGLIDQTCYGMTITFANNAANNSKTWTATVNNGFLTFNSSAGDVAGPYSGPLSDVAASIASNTSWFSGVSLNPYIAFLPASFTTFANTSDLPNWTSPPFQRSVNGTTMGIPLAFANAEPAPSTYDCGIYTSYNKPFFGTDYSSVVGTFSFDESTKRFNTYLSRARYPKKTSFVPNNTNRGLYYTDEYDYWLSFPEGATTWKFDDNAPSIHTNSYSVPGLSGLNESFEITFRNCYINGSPNIPEYGDQLCDNGENNGPSSDCPSTDYWSDIIYERMPPGFAVPGILNCEGNYISPFPCTCQDIDPGWVGPCPGTDICICGFGRGTTGIFPATSTISTQTLNGSWILDGL